MHGNQKKKMDQINKCTGYEHHSETGMVRACSLPAGHKGRHKHKISPPTPLLLWNQAVAVLREDKYLVTQSSRNYATALSRVGLGSPADEMNNIYDCNCRNCLAQAEQDGVDAYRNYRDKLCGRGVWE